MPETKTRVDNTYCAEVMKQLDMAGVSQLSWSLCDGGIAVAFRRSGETFIAIMRPDETREPRQFVRDALAPPAKE